MHVHVLLYIYILTDCYFIQIVENKITCFYSLITFVRMSYIIAIYKMQIVCKMHHESLWESHAWHYMD